MPHNKRKLSDCTVCTLYVCARAFLYALIQRSSAGGREKSFTMILLIHNMCCTLVQYIHVEFKYWHEINVTWNG